MDFILDPSLVLYLPLYEPGSIALMSKDAYGHLAMITGALWTPQGRTFDGIDDRIQTGATVPFNTDNVYTALAWVYPTTDIDPATFLSFGTNSPSGQYLEEFALRNLSVSFANYAGNWTGSGGLLSLNSWYHLALIHDGVNDNVKIYVNGALGLDASYPTDLLTTTGAVTVGCNNTTTPTEFFAGKVGEVWVHKRALTRLEIQHNYLVTKWRYQ